MIHHIKATVARAVTTGLVAGVVAAGLPVAQAAAPSTLPPSADVAAAGFGDDVTRGLRDVAPDDVRIGTAVAPGPMNNNTTYRETLAREFNSVTSENSMKWQTLQPQRGVFNFTQADEMIDFAEANGQDVYGHVLVWHSQLPNWLEQGVNDGTITPDEFRDIVKEHVQTVVTHFKGRVTAWDVVNEAIADDGTLRDSIFLQQMGPDYIADVFRWAHEADPNALLFINDYNVEWTDETANDQGHHQRGQGYYDLVKHLVDNDVPIDGVGVQSHFSINGYMSTVTEPYDLTHITENLRRFSDLDLRTAVTEVDVGMPMPADSVKLHAQAHGFNTLLTMCLQTPGCERFTLWGFTDQHNWIPGHRPGWGAATPFTTTYQPKPAYHALHATLRLATAAHDATTCTTVIEERHRGPLTVSSGTTCIEADATVTGPITVSSGASLLADGARLTGPLNADGADRIVLNDVHKSGPVNAAGVQSVEICGSTMRGPVNVTGASSVVIGDPDAGCEPNTHTGTVQVRSTAGLSVIAGNQITGPLQCSDNDPAPTNRGHANTGNGPRQGQCADL